MNQTEIDLCISYGQEKVLFFFEKNTTLPVLLSIVAKHFKIPELQIKLIEEERNAEITYTRALNPNKEYRIILKQLESNQFQRNLPNVSRSDALSCQSNSSHLNNVLYLPGKINLDYFQDLKVSKEYFLLEINEWAGTLKFKLSLSEGKKKTKKGYKRTLVCSDPQCKFKLIFFSDLEETEYSLNFELSTKYDTHSKF